MDNDIHGHIYMNNFTLVNCDTDSIAFCKKDGSPFTKEEQEYYLKDLNSNFPEKIFWEHDGIFERLIILKAKNYILYQNEKIKLRGSSLKSSKTEKALKEFIDEIINCLVFDKQNELQTVYTKYIQSVYNITDITPWTSKKTITEKVLNPKRTNEQKIFDALEGENYQMGDKVYVYFTEDKKLRLKEHWNNDHDKKVLLKKLFQTLSIFKNVIDIKQFKNYTLKKNLKELEELLK